MKITENALVLREVKVGESDRILTLMTRGHGLLSVSAKGSLNPKNKLFSASGLFSYSEWVLREGRSTYFAEEATPIEVFFGLRDSVEKFALAAYLAEILALLSPTGEEAGHLMGLTLRSFYLLAEDKRSLETVKAVYELRALSESGFMPDVLACRECGRYDGGAFHFDARRGYLTCGSCAEKTGLTTNLNPGALAALRHIVLANDDKVFGFTLAADSFAALAVLAEQYILHHLDYPPKSLAFLHTVLHAPAETAILQANEQKENEK